MIYYIYLQKPEVIRAKAAKIKRTIEEATDQQLKKRNEQ